MEYKFFIEFYCKQEEQSMYKTSVCTSQGGRPYQEDTHCVKNVHKGVFLCAVFDGHGGADVANTCKNNVAEVFKQCYLNKTMNDMSVTLHQTFKSLDDLTKVANNPMMGCTAALAIITPDKIWFANAGDSMSMIWYDDDSVELMSHEHKAENEKERLQAAGAMITYWDGVGRVNGTLNLSRSIGDHYMKQYIISDPFIRSIKRKKNMKRILVASDGLWDVYNAESIRDDMNMFRSILENENTGKPVETIKVVEKLVQRAHQKGSTDNITVVVIDLK